ncbi:group I truncated hemoglobin [Micromonospora sp. NBC_01796]|uniref:group I truncated hemoglobin n=1 Tax=Micromonospora sp. NBC_01796 TaxID=2975987 RepID=UPI002DDC3D0E|nr:group 1 truncated hemoglobin [Micromonospora sp. NBC_01796]WSA84998.1 group 1 truncated hemoglobin [Micromonospora sp. NBC_01796]
MTETEANASSTRDASIEDTVELPEQAVPGGDGDGDGSAYERIGGAVAVQAAVRIFYERVLAEPDLAGYFETVDMAAQRRHLGAMLTVLLGGPDAYAGRGLAQAHQGLGIPSAHYARVGAHLLATLMWLDVPADVVDHIRETLAQVESQVVQSRSRPAG